MFSKKTLNSGVQGYLKCEISFIEHYAKHFHITEEEAVRRWVEEGHAKHFAELYRRIFDLPQEGQDE